MDKYMQFSFKPIGSFQDFFGAIQDFNKTICNQMEQVIEGNVYFLAAEQEKCSLRGFAAIVERLFLSEFVYWPQYSTMALFGGYIPYSLKQAIFGNVICLSANMDSSVLQQRWPAIPLMQQIISEVNQLSNQELVSEEELRSCCAEQDLATIVQKNKNIMICKRISHIFHLNDLLCSAKDGQTIIRSQALITDSDVDKATNMAKSLMENLYRQNYSYYDY